MNFIKTLMVLVIACFSLTSAAQSAAPGFQATDIYSGFGHCIMPESMNYAADVNLGGQQNLFCTIEVKEFGVWNPWTELTSLGHLVYGGIDQFQIPLVGSNNWDINVLYRYTVDPDGSGPLNAGDVAFNVFIGDVYPKDQPDLHFTEYEITGPYLYVQTECGRYADYNNYSTELVLDVKQNGQTIYYDSSWVNPAGSQVFGRSWTVYLPIAAQGSGDICATARLRYSHDGPGFSDFTAALVDQTNGNNCDYWPGLSTGVDEHDGSAASVEVQYAFDQIKVVGAPANALVCIHNVTGQVVHTARASETVSATGWTPGIYLVRVADEATGLVETKRLFIGSGR